MVDRPQPLRSYLQRLMWLYLAPLLLLLVGMTTDVVRRVHAQRVAEVQALAVQVKLEIDADLGRRIHGSETLAVTEPSYPSIATRSIWHTHARRYDEAFGAALVVVTADGSLLLHSRVSAGDPLPAPHPDTVPAMEMARSTGKPAVVYLAAGVVLRKPLVVVISPIQRASGNWTFMNAVEAQHYQRLLDALPMPLGWRIRLVDKMGQTIAARGPQLEGEAATPSSERDVSMVTSRAPWTVRVHVDALPFYTPHLQVAGYLLAGLLFMGAGTTLVARRGSRRLVATMHRLADGAAVDSAVSAAELRIAEIESVHGQMQRLRLARASAQERERKRIARDLHDGMQQGLAAVQIDIDLARARVEGIDLPATELLHRVRGNVEGLIGELDNIVRELRPAALEHLGLKAAIEQQIDRLCRMSRLQIELEVVGEEAACSGLSPVVAECAYRVVQECLNNVHKHANASFVHVVLDASVPHRIVLQVSDDGCGLPDARTMSQAESFGLTGIRERVSALGGWVHLMSARDSASEFSTTVLVALPLRDAPES